MNWNSGYSARYYMTEVDAATWRDIARVEITGGNVSRSASELMESAEVDVSNYRIPCERWIRIYLDARQEDAAARTPLFTGLATSPDGTLTGIIEERSLQCYSVLKPADIPLKLGWYANGGELGTDIVRDLLSVTPAPIIAEEGSPRLSAPIIAEENETRLSMAWAVLDAMNWRLRIAGDGTITICRKASQESAVFDALSNDVIEPEVKEDADYFSCPNVFQAIVDDMVAVARDDDPDSWLSTVRRGREVPVQEKDCSLASGETLAEYAQRRLKELQRVSRSLSYKRRFDPDITVGDLVRINYPTLQARDGLDHSNVYAITQQSIDLGYGARMSETAEEV
jgi:hypothetical protein